MNKFETLAIHADRDLDGSRSVSPPIYQTSTFEAASCEDFAEMATTIRHDRFYTRYGNPTHKQAEAVMTALEGAESAMMTASGMGAIATTVFTLVAQGDHVIGQQNHYAGTTSLLRDILPRFGVGVTLVDQTDLSAFERAVGESTRLVIVESPSNPVMKLTDLKAVAKLARERNIVTLADNTLATPVNQRPIEMGIDLVVHSGTKYLGGHSDLTAGVIVGSEKLLGKIWETSLVFGATLGPFDSWLLRRGLRTLSLRVERHNQTALSIARFLESHPKVRCVHYPGIENHPQFALAQRQMAAFTGVLAFELKDGQEAADRFIESLKLATQAASFGGVHTLVVRPTGMLAHQVSEEDFGKVGVEPGLIRLSVGLENEQDLIADIARALG